MNKLEGIDGSKFLIDPLASNEVLLSKFKQYPEFREDLTFDKYSGIRHIILMYDIHNDEVQALYPDYMSRKRSCAQLAGFELTKNRFNEDVEQAILGKNPVFNSMILRYVRLFNNPDYVAYVSFWEMLVQNFSQSLAETDVKTINTIRTNIDGLRNQISVITKSIFRGDDSDELRKALYATMEEEKLKLRPEFMANQILKKQVDFTPKTDIHKTIQRATPRSSI
jgi:hypothetical protein